MLFLAGPVKLHEHLCCHSWSTSDYKLFYFKLIQVLYTTLPSGISYKADNNNSHTLSAYAQHLVKTSAVSYYRYRKQTISTCEKCSSHSPQQKGCNVAHLQEIL